VQNGAAPKSAWTEQWSTLPSNNMKQTKTGRTICASPPIIFLDIYRIRAQPGNPSSTQYVGPSIQVRSFFRGFFVSKNYVLSDAAMKVAYLSLAIAALVFVSLLMLTTLHP
jgi:hypothetical protein